MPKRLPIPGLGTSGRFFNPPVCLTARWQASIILWDLSCISFDKGSKGKVCEKSAQEANYRDAADNKKDHEGKERLPDLAV
jgi:hypothetical protein